MFQFPRLPPSALFYSGGGCLGMTPGGFPHSGIPGSKAVCASPGLIAACRALHRLPVPRHPPCALDIFASEDALRYALHSRLNLVRSVDLEESHRFANREELRIRLNLVFSLSLCSCQGARRAHARAQGRPIRRGPGSRMLRSTGKICRCFLFALFECEIEDSLGSP